MRLELKVIHLLVLYNCPLPLQLCGIRLVYEACWLVLSELAQEGIGVWGRRHLALRKKASTVLVLQVTAGGSLATAN